MHCLVINYNSWVEYASAIITGSGSILRAERNFNSYSLKAQVYLMDKIKLTIDGVEVRVKTGTTVLQAAQSAGVYIPALCSHPDLPSSREVKANDVVYRGSELIKNDNSAKEFEGCQLCVVEIEGMEGLPTACTIEAAEGMEVHICRKPDQYAH